MTLTRSKNSHSGLHFCSFMAYGIFFGWSIHGRLTCPICGSDTDYFCLTASGKISYFDCHECWLPLKHTFRIQKDSFRKDTVVKKGPPKHLSEPKIAESHNKLVLNREGIHICALWELPYAHALILMHNIDVMHQECNIAENIVSTCLNITGKTKDNFMAQRYITDICNHPLLKLDERGGK
jgi:hypothetical protein